MATKLHQILALEKGVKGQTESAVTRAHHNGQRHPLFSGLTRVYKPLDQENGETLPSERKVVQHTTDSILNTAASAWVRQTDIVATKDATNQTARANVIVDGDVLIGNVPVATLLYLEKTLQNVRELISKLPVLDPEVEWLAEPDFATGLWKSTTEESVRTKKVPRAVVLYPATDKHPAQVENIPEDVIVGKWDKTLFSGALPAGRKAQLLARVERLSEAVKMAREYANQADAVDRTYGAAIFGHLLA